MGVISTNPKQINCIYSGTTNFGKQVLAYVNASEKDILAIDINKTMPSSTQWQEIATDLHTSIETFIDKKEIKELTGDSDFNEDNYLKILENNPKALKGAILISGDKKQHITNYTEAMELFGVDSAGLEKTFYTEPPTINTTTEDENFKKSND